MLRTAQPVLARLLAGGVRTMLITPAAVTPDVPLEYAKPNVLNVLNDDNSKWGAAAGSRAPPHIVRDDTLEVLNAGDKNGAQTDTATGDKNGAQTDTATGDKNGAQTDTATGDKNGAGYRQSKPHGKRLRGPHGYRQREPHGYRQREPHGEVCDISEAPGPRREVREELPELSWIEECGRIELLHHKENLVIVNKPAAVSTSPPHEVSVRESLSPNLETLLYYQINRKLVPINKLWASTTGIVVFSTQRFLHATSERPYLRKVTYTAVLNGKYSAVELDQSTERMFFKIRVLGHLTLSLSDFTVVSITATAKPEFQLRAALKELGLQVATVYGRRLPLDFMHLSEAVLYHPEHRMPLKIHSKLPMYFANTIKRMSRPSDPGHECETRTEPAE